MGLNEDEASPLGCRTEGATDAQFELSPGIRYVAFGRGQEVAMRERPSLEAPSLSESDRYEVSPVNPTLLTLARQRGGIDCGGLRDWSSGTTASTSS